MTTRIFFAIIFILGVVIPFGASCVIIIFNRFQKVKQNSMKVPQDIDLAISQFHFIDGAIEVARWKDIESNMIQTVFRKEKSSWYFSKPGCTADAVLRIHYIDKKSTLDQAWDILSGYME